MTSKLIRSGIALLALLAAPLAARAADLGPAPPYKAPAYVAPVFSWTGFYVGANLGYAWGKTKWDYPPGIDWDPSGFIGGVTAGYNWQTGSWVWGLEADFDYTGVDKSHACAPAGANCEFQNDWLGTARGRIGYAGWTNFMPYITGGAAFAHVKASNDNFGGSKSDWMFGWTAGLGVEYALWTNWSLKAEYLYADLGKTDCGASCNGVGGTDNVTYKTNIFRLGANYRF